MRSPSNPFAPRLVSQPSAPAGSPERRHYRRALELRVQFRADRSQPPRVGLGTNLSAGGVFIASLENEPVGTRLEVRFTDGGEWALEGEVVHSVHGGMGVRFLSVEELITELLTPPEEDIPVSDPALPEEPVDEPVAATGTTGTAATEAFVEQGVFEMVYGQRQQLEAAYERDAKTGGLFVRTARAATLGQTIELRVRLDGSDEEPASLQAKVVHATSSGMGVEFCDRNAALDALAALLEASASAAASVTAR